ncbi:superoxide reductase [hydrocarbon metagenome]|uniref:Superoxide reductase n=1 Tax=hydrocarbon metagenome TaxID=938273 RepID=A0A0W8EA16_9ZZZZ
MTTRLDVYKCEICGNIVEVLHEGKGTLVCCNKDMVLYKENTIDASVEKHVPVISRSADGVKVAIGSDLHPMIEKHYIEWIEVIAGDKVYREFLKPDQKPEAVFKVADEKLTSRAYCNIHGLWKVV